MLGASDGSNGRATKRFFPALDKRTLFASGYIAMRSAHSTGTAVDLTLIKLPAVSVAPFDSTAAYGSCIGPAAERAPDNSLDMGTGFNDCFDVKSHTANTSISPDARQWRAMFVRRDAQAGSQEELFPANGGTSHMARRRRGFMIFQLWRAGVK